ncbi:hypothetical protein [Aquimarina megaterium]|uniref:hypothetical protein n=1 Tax=Aquimarina megaterium TaxID=1443666 RepID=UPI0004715DA0|nr:hypothetical protein [Aquimarina megaterium]
MKTHYLTTVILSLSITLIGCKQQKKNVTEEEIVNPHVKESIEVQQSITIEKLENSPAYTDAALTLDLPETIKISQRGDMDFTFNLENYELGAQTQGPNSIRLANSGKGQHIHFILDNQPYSAHYEPNFKKEIPDGVHHLVAFLSRSYHESVKNTNSVVVRKLMVGANPQDSQGLDMKAPTLIYSRPKGEYAGKGAESLLLDFFVLNTTLSEDGHKVRATINGEEFIITEWAPQVIKGLPMGEVSIQLELLDETGTLIPGPFNKVTRTVLLKE